MDKFSRRRLESPAMTRHRLGQEAHRELWRQVPFAPLLTEGQREQIDRICLRSGRHLGDVLAELVGYGLQEFQILGVNGAGIDERRAA